jgi:N-methylhydantoinase A
VEVSRTVLARLERGMPAPDLGGAWVSLEAAAHARLPGSTLSRVADCRYAGQSHELRIPLEAQSDAAAELDAAHERAYGYAMPDEPVDVVTLRVIAEHAPLLEQAPTRWDLGEAGPPRTRALVLDGATVTATVLDRAGLVPGDEIRGPALVEQPDTTVLLRAGDVAHVDGAGNLVVEVP